MSQSLKKPFPCNTKMKGKKDNIEKNLHRNRGYWYCFTLNNHDAPTLVSLSLGKFGDLQIEKLVCQEEVGDEKNTPHLQGVVKFKNQTEFNSVRKNMPRAHIEKTRNIIGSMKYCSKIDTAVGKMITFGDVGRLLPAKKKKKLNDEEICRFIRDSLRADGIDIPIRYKRIWSSPP